MGSRRRDLADDIGPMGKYIDSFDLTMAVAEKSKNTRRIYTDAAGWFGAWVHKNKGVRSWEKVDRDHLSAFFLHMQEIGYEQGYRNNIGRGLQAFFKWWAAEEELPDPFDKFKAPPPPKLDAKIIPVIAAEQLRALIKEAESGRDFESRRDAALLRLFASTGCRLSEITYLQTGDIDVKARSATVTGKGNRQRTVRFDAKCALAVDRYLRKRAEHPAADLGALWLGLRRRMPMTPSGIRQVIERRGERLGMDIHPHLFRHTFSHNWLDEGGAEGDLMELNGWDSPQMLRHYGRSARGARARRAYDRVNVMKDI